MAPPLCFCVDLKRKTLCFIFLSQAEQRARKEALVKAKDEVRDPSRFFVGVDLHRKGQSIFFLPFHNRHFFGKTTNN